MIKDSSLRALQNELSTAIVYFKEDGNVLNLHFNEQLNFKEFQQNLEHLYHEFAKEHRYNLRHLEHTGELDLYFKMLINVFDLLRNKVGIQPNFVSPHRNNLKVSSCNSYITCIHACADELEQMIIYFQFQKKIIEMSMELIYCSKKEPVYRGDDSREYVRLWETIWLDFDPYKSRLIEDLGNINSIQKKIQYLKKERKRLDLELSKRGLDLYKPPISLFFDTSFICLNDLLVSSNDNLSATSASLKWNDTKNAFLELILGLDQAGCICRKDSKELSRKELINQFGAFLNVSPISDFESRIYKLVGRSKRTPFLDKLRNVITSFAKAM